jgi:D-alanyl-D-alanine carboxypeptidase
MTSQPIRLPRVASCVAIALAAALAACGSDDGLRPPTRDDQRQADSVAAAVRATFDLPAMAVALVHADGEPALAATGVRRLDALALATTADLWHLGSNAKAMTATMIGALVERGRLAWTSTPGELFPEHRAAMHPRLRDATLLQLLSHHAGIRPDSNVAAFDSLPAFPGSPREQRRAYALRVLGDTPSAAPGAYLYSNAGYTVAAAMAEQAAQASWESLMQRYVYEPLGIRGVVGWPGTGRSNQPWGHVEVGGRLVPHDPNGGETIPAIIAPAGDLSMTLRDYARFAQTHLRGELQRNALLRATTMATLHTVIGDDYALGWQEIDIAGVHLSTHQGSAGTFYSAIAIAPARNVAAVAITNAGTEAAALATAIAVLRLTGVELGTSARAAVAGAR